MNKQEAIERIKQNKAAAEFHAQMVGDSKSVENELKDIKAFDMAIEALSEPSGDLVSRADAIEAVCGDCTIENRESCKRDGYCYEVRNLMALPSAEPKTGKWIRKTEVLNSDGQQGRYYWHECDQCGERPPYTKFMNENLSNYCPNCGAEMKGGGSE